MRKVLPFVFLSALLVAVDASADSHRSTGLVVKLNTFDRTVTLLEDGRQLKLVVGRGAKLLDDHGHRLDGLKRLQVGDYVREECSGREGGSPIARNIDILVPAWRMLESPEH